MTAQPKIPPLTVGAREAGQKLFQFLLRHLEPDIPAAYVHRIIRSGEVRIDGKRAAPFMRLEEGQSVRMPPGARRAKSPSTARQELLPVQLVAETQDILVFNKPRGLPVHGGTGHMDSLTARARAHFPAEGFAPTPVHRLDKDTSGLVVMARSYAALARLNALFAQKTADGAGGVEKDYLAWVSGVWEMPSEGIWLEDQLAKTHLLGKGERVLAAAGSEGRRALAHARFLEARQDCSLLLIRLVTGRTHQIRAQLAMRGHPVAGDRKYGAGGDLLLLHAWRLALPEMEPCEILPDWPAPFAVTAAPKIIPPLTALHNEDQPR